MEMLQLSMLNPKLAILDETDSGLDVDALQVIAQTVNDFKNKERSILIITHYNRILKYIKPDRIHILVKGKIVKSGDAKLAVEIEKMATKNSISTTRQAWEKSNPAPYLKNSQPGITESLIRTISQEKESQLGCLNIDWLV